MQGQLTTVNLKMRSSKEIKQIFIELAREDKRIRAILLQGSRANKNINPDPHQDFDIVLIVTQMEQYIADHGWTSLFGERLIWQLPDEMEIGNNLIIEKSSFHYLMLFKDGTRIDLTLFPMEKLKSHFKPDSLTILWLDKDELFTGIEMPSDKDYLIRRPAEKEFLDTCNEFWWVCLYISKGLLRKEITYAKAMMEGPVRKMFMRMIEWYIGTETKFSVSFGKDGKFMKEYLDENAYKAILETYPDYKSENIWNSLFKMTELFSKYANHVSRELVYKYNPDEQENVKKYLNQQRLISFPK
jgi:aminoglycoside 6-adenylyltransferase